MQLIKAIEKDAINKSQTQIFMEAPYRNNRLFADLMQYCRPYTRLCVAKDISGALEMIKTRTILDWKKSRPDLHKVPTIFLVYS